MLQVNSLSYLSAIFIISKSVLVSWVKFLSTCLNSKTNLESGLLILRDGAISHNRPQIASDRTIHEKSHNSQKDAQNS